MGNNYTLAAKIMQPQCSVLVMLHPVLAEYELDTDLQKDTAIIHKHQRRQ